MHVSHIDAALAHPLAESRPGPSKRVQRRSLYALIFAFDLCAILIAIGVPVAMDVYSRVDQSMLALLAGFIALYSVFALRSVSADTIVDWRRGVGAALLALSTAAVVMLTVAFWAKVSTDISRAYVLIGFLSAAGGIIVGRAVSGQIGARILASSPFGILVITEDEDAPTVKGSQVRTARELGLDGNLSNPLMLDRLARCLGRYDRVIVACTDDRRAAWATALKASPTRADMLLPELDRFGALGCDRFGGVPLVPISSGQMRIRDELLKRGLDIVLASLALVFLGPLMIVTAIAVKLETPGPILFRQRRVGRGNQLFEVLKFRSMRVASCDANGRLSTQRGDSRITRVGRIIRSTSIDELPQLINVLRGDMSIVGPRPHALESLAGNQLFWEVDQNYHHRHACKPGLTGLAQVRGFRGATEKPEDLINRLEADLEYVHGWSIWRDVEIMAATLKVVVHKNAY